MTVLAAHDVGVTNEAPIALARQEESVSDRTLSDTELLSARLVPLRRPGQWVSAAVVVVLLAMVVHTLLTNQRFQWPIVWSYFTTGPVLNGLVLTLWLTAAVMICGYVLGVVFAVMRLSRNAVLDRKSTRLNSSHITPSRMPSSA